MNIMFEIYDKFNSIFKESGKCYLASGCVRDYLMNKEAKDYDFFCLFEYDISKSANELKKLLNF